MLCGRNNSREARVARPIVLSALSFRIGALARCLFRIGEQAFGDVFSCGGCLVSTASHDLHVSSGNGSCSAFASSRGARIQTSRSSSVVRITGIAFGWADDCVRRCGQEAIGEMRSDIRASTSYPAVIFMGERKASRAVVSISIYEKRPRRNFTKFRYRGCGGRPLDTTARQAVSFVVPARPTGRTRRPATSRAG